MNKFKKTIIFFISILIIFLLSINIYIISSHNSLSSQVEDLYSIKSKISLLDSFKTNIVNLGHYQKFYLLSKDESYKTKYSNYLSDSYDMLDDLVKTTLLQK